MLRRGAASPAAALLVALGTVRANAGALGPKLPRLPLDPPIRLTSGFGETRAQTFHAGLDLATGERIGARVVAPLSGSIERVRSSGVGYGRSLYLRADDGRLLVFGHLDGFAQAIAAYVDSAQRASGEYEQDLWPAARRFRVTQGELLAWSGESGAGAPHLHFEIRRGDFALNPLRAGVALADSAAPRLLSLTLEPLDDSSWVDRRASPATRVFGARAETLVVEGRVRVAVRAIDPGSGGERTPPWSVSLRWADETTEARFDSVSWDGDMSEVDAVYDRGHIANSQGLILYAPPARRPRVLRSSRPDSATAGRIELRAGDAARPLELVAQDAAGNATRRTVWLRGPRVSERGPDTLGPRPRGAAGSGSPPRWSFASLPDHYLRVTVSGAPIGVRDVRIERARAASERDIRPATWAGGGWSAVLMMNGVPDGEGFWIKGVLPDGKAWWSRGTFAAWPAGTDLYMEPDRLANMTLPLASVFEEGILLTDWLPAATAPGGGLRAATTTLRISPADWPLKRTLGIRMRLPVAMSARGVGLYRRDEGGWTMLRATYDSTARTYSGESSSFGEFALFADERAPEVALRPVASRAEPGPYSRWRVEASVIDEGSGIDARASTLRVDGRRVPTEWDPESRVLRWRPLAPPAAGAHDVEVVAQDRAGNRTIRRGRFVLDSRSR